MAVVYTMVDFESLPPEDVVVFVVLHDDLHPSQSMNHMSFPEADNMHDSLYLHAPQIDKMNNTGLLALTPSSACTYIIFLGAHRLDICDTMVLCHNSEGLVPQIANNCGIPGKYL